MVDYLCVYVLIGSFLKSCLFVILCFKNENSVRAPALRCFGEQDTGVIYGMTSACSAVMGSVGTYLTGVLLDTTDSWVLVFQASGGAGQGGWETGARYVLFLLK